MAEGGYDIELDPLNEENTILNDDEEETDFGGHDDSSIFRHFNTSIEDDDSEEISKKLDNLLNSKSEEDEAKDFIKSIYDEADLKKISVKKHGDLVFISLKRKNAVWFIVKEDGIQERYGKKTSDSLLKYLGKKKIDRVSEDISIVNSQKEELEKKISEEHERLKKENYNLKKKEGEYLVENKKIINRLKQSEEELKNYNEEIITLRLKIRNNPSIENQEQLNNLNKDIIEKEKYNKYIEDKIKTNKELYENFEKEIDKNERLISTSISERQDELEGLNQELEKLNTKHEELYSKMSLRNKLKYIFKKYGLTVFSITTSVGVIITEIVKSLVKGVKAVANTVANQMKAFGKYLAENIPGIIGAIVSYIFKAAGEAVGFLAKNAWLLILFVVTFVVEQYISKK